jgi:hypothetical protein
MADLSKPGADHAGIRVQNSQSDRFKAQQQDQSRPPNRWTRSYVNWRTKNSQDGTRSAVIMRAKAELIHALESHVLICTSMHGFCGKCVITCMHGFFSRGRSSSARLRVTSPPPERSALMPTPDLPWRKYVGLCQPTTALLPPWPKN